ncbi:MAG: TraR/DksA C4-type zinc finger protein [Acidimicrobiia bacterium]
MTRTLSAATIKKLRRRLEADLQGLQQTIDDHLQDLEEARLAQASGERSADPSSTETGSAATVFESELSVVRNSQELLGQVEDALERLDAGTYGMCINCGKPIPAARLDAIPYTTLCVACAARR